MEKKSLTDRLEAKIQGNEVQKSVGVLLQSSPAVMNISDRDRLCACVSTLRMQLKFSPKNSSALRFH